MILTLMTAMSPQTEGPDTPNRCQTTGADEGRLLPRLTPAVSGQRGGAGHTAKTLFPETDCYQTDGAEIIGCKSKALVFLFFLNGAFRKAFQFKQLTKQKKERECP